MVRIPARPIDAALIVLCVDRVERCCIGRHLNKDRQVARDKMLDCKSSAPVVPVFRYAGAISTSAKTRAAFEPRSNDLVDFKAILDSFRLFLSPLR